MSAAASGGPGAGAGALEVGYVSRAHGIRGEVAVKPFDPASTTLASLERLIIRGKDGACRTVAVRSARPAHTEALLVLEGVDSRAAAEALRGSTVLAFREDLEPPDEGEFFQGDLVGMTAVTEEGRVLGRVEEIWETGPVPNLVIRQDGQPEVVVPFAEEFVPTVDVEARRLVVRPPEFFE